MSELLKQFYKDIHTWVMHGCQEHPVFAKDIALCRTLVIWCQSKDLYGKDIDKLYREQKAQFADAGLDDLFPFNPDTYQSAHLPDSFSMEIIEKRLYYNSARVAWIIARGMEE